MLVRKMYRGMNGIRIRVKTDGNQYVLGLTCRLNMSYMQYVVWNTQALVQDQSKEWVNLELPIDNLVSDEGKNNTAVNYDTELSGGIRINAVSLGIYSHDQKEGTFEMRLAKIEAIYKEEFEEVKKKYLYPVMFKMVGDRWVDTGKERILFEEGEKEEKD
jgi:hypothetical protein